MNTLLSAHPALGVVWFVVLFLLCFLCVHIARLVEFGWKYQKKNDPAPKPAPEREKPQKTEPTEKKAPAENTPQEPVYYIVEKKRRTKTTFGEPKQIRFK